MKKKLLQYREQFPNRRNGNIIATPNIQIRDHSNSWIGIGTSIKCNGVRLVSWTYPRPLLVKWCRNMIYNDALQEHWNINGEINFNKRPDQNLTDIWILNAYLRKLWDFYSKIIILFQMVALFVSWNTKRKKSLKTHWS